MSESKSKIDAFFDIMDGVADKAEGVLKGMHYPDKNYDHPDAEDAVIVSHTVDITLGLVDESWHLFPGLASKAMCKDKPFRPESIDARKRVGGNGSVRVCCACLAIAFQTQSVKQTVKELTDGNG
jgi:hypothetical protein